LGIQLGVVITVIGWAALIKRILLLLIPGQMMDMSKNWFKKRYFVASAGGVAVLSGVLLPALLAIRNKYLAI